MRLLKLYLICVSVIFFLGLLFVVQQGTNDENSLLPNQPQTIAIHIKGIEIRQNVYYLLKSELSADSDPPVFLADKPWQRYSGRTINLGNQEKTLWLHFSLFNDSQESTPVTLELGWPFLHDTSVWIPSDDMSSASSGDSGPAFMQAQEIEIQRHPSYSFALAGKTETEIYIRVQGSAKLIVPMTLWELPSFAAHQAKLRAWFTGFFSAVTVMLVYNFFLFFFTRDKSYLFYCVYTCSVLFYVSAISGIGRQLLWPGDGWLQTHSYGLSSSFSFLTVVFFMRSFLSLRTIGGWTLHISTVLAVSWTVILTAYAFSRAPLILLAEDLTAFASCGAGLATTIYLWWKGNVSAKYLTIAWTILILSTLLLMLGLTNITAYAPASLYIQMVGFVVELVLISIALAERINRERTEKEAAQQRALGMSLKMRAAQDREMTAQRELLQLKENANLELENRVLLRTSELQKALQALEAANQELAEISITDPLTGLANRRYYEQILDNEIQRAKRAGCELSLLVVDIDYFKQMNDTYGHQAGDQCLALVAQTVQQQVTRPADFVARFGGEEFVVVLPETAQDQAELIAEKIRAACSAACLPIADDNLHITVSVGVASTSTTTGYNPKQLFEDADQALYRAKKGGRNQISTALPRE